MSIEEAMAELRDQHLVWRRYFVSSLAGTAGDQSMTMRELVIRAQEIADQAEDFDRQEWARVVADFREGLK